MESTRQTKVAKQIQRDLSEIFQKQASIIAPGKMLTVTVVRITPDLGLARVYISVFPSDDVKKALDSIIHHTGLIRNELAKKIRHQVKKIPELEFFNDDSLDYIDNIDHLLHK